MNTMLTDAAIQYTWDQIFYRLGLKQDASEITFSDKKITFCYRSALGIEIPSDQYLLNILPCTTTDFDQLINDLELKLIWLKKEAFLPNLSDEFPVEKLPVLFWGESASKNRFAEIQDGNRLIIHVDIIASVFFLLSRIEEYSSKVSDRYGRYPFSESAAYRHGFIDLPIVDLYVKILKYWLEAATKQEIPDTHQFRVSLSHDIDFISLFRPVIKGIATIGKDALKMNVKNLGDDLHILFNSYNQDPYYSGINYLADQSEKFGFSSTFNIMAAAPSFRDTGYSLSSSIARNMLNIIIKKGHKIGLHSSFLSFNKPEKLAKEKSELEKFTGRNVDTVRSHYLRLETPDSWKIWQAAGIKYDTSYGFSEHVGFRCGTCFPYQPFDISEDKPIGIIEEPLVVMDTTLKSFQNFTLQEAREKINCLAALCKFVGGNFTLLWHNTSFFRDWMDWGNAYPEILSSLSSLLNNN